MTEKPLPPSTPSVVPSQILSLPSHGSPVKDIINYKVETAEEEPYTIKCICNFSDDDGNTIYCETCDTWQHIDCFYPDNRDEAIREDFAHSCAECKPRPLDRQKAIERTLRLRNAAAEETPDRKTKPSKSHKKKPKPSEIHVNGNHEGGKTGSPNDQHTHKRTKSSHRLSQSAGSQPSKRSPSYGNARSNPVHPPSPATTPPDLPEDFHIHHYSNNFHELYTGQDVPESHNNAFASLAIPTALTRWLREPEKMKQEVGRTQSEVFQSEPTDIDDKKPILEVQEATKSIDADSVLRWRFLKSTPVDKDVPLIELNGEIGFQKDYCTDEANFWIDLSSPLPFVFFHPILPLYIDTRKEGSLARYVRRSCKPNAQLDTYLSTNDQYHFWIVSDRYISADEQITLPWDFRLEKSVNARWMHFLGLSDDVVSAQMEPEMDETEYVAISNWIDRILSEYGGCACDLDNNCAFARFHRHYLFGKSHGRSTTKRKPRKTKTYTISPTSTGHATNSRAASEGQVDENVEHNGRSQSVSSRSKPSSRDPTPLRQGSFDQLGILTEPTDRDKRKVAMVEDTFRRMEQQQPPRKKKRVSDGTSSSKSKPRTGLPYGTYVDAATSRSKSGSPVSGHSPQPGQKAFDMRKTSSADQSRQSSANPQPLYCDAAVQTDPVEGEWFSEPAVSPRLKKRVISLSKRLLNNRHRLQADETEHVRRQSFATQASSVATVMELDSPSLELKPIISHDGGLQSPVSQPEDIHMMDAPAALATTPGPESSSREPTASPVSTKTPDLRVQVPPVPAFDNTSLANPVATPSTMSSMAQSPLALNNAPSPLNTVAINGLSAHPSPVKKKLSLKDYTKSRMNKAAGKVSGGTTLLKPSLSSPEASRVDITIEPNHMGKAVDNVEAPAMALTTNGSSQ